MQLRQPCPTFKKTMTQRRPMFFQPRFEKPILSSSQGFSSNDIARLDPAPMPTTS
jgi:hypothetical protein